MAANALTSDSRARSTVSDATAQRYPIDGAALLLGTLASASRVQVASAITEPVGNRVPGHAAGLRHLAHPTLGVTIVEVRQVSIVNFNPADHEGQTLGMLARMRSEPYPGPAGGHSRSDLKSWLELSAMDLRRVAVSSSGRVLGHVGLKSVVSYQLDPVDVHTFEVTRLFVDPEVRGQGVGYQLLNWAQAAAASAGAAAVLSVAEVLDGAIFLYETCGWTLTGTVKSELSGETLRVYKAPYLPVA